MTAPEAWLRGPVPGVAEALQPVAHALLQASEDMERVLRENDPDSMEIRPGGAASIGFHVRHAAGALDRLFTYARGEPLSDEQKAFLRTEALAPAGPIDLGGLFRDTIERALAQLRRTDPARLTDPRPVGRAGLPSSVLGLLFHGAEHTARHTGQAITTALILRGMESRR